MSDHSENDGNQADPQSFLEQLVGEGKKYSSVEELAKAKIHADKHIEQLEQESQVKNQTLEKMMTLEDMLRKNEERSKETVKDEPKADDPAQKQTEQAENNEDDIAAKVREILAEENRKATTDQNLNSVAERLLETYGSEDKAREYVELRAKELGVSSQFLMDTAATSPKAFYEVVGLNRESGSKSKGGKTFSDVNSEAFSASSPKKSGNSLETYSDFQELRRTDPAKFRSAKIQNLLFEKRSELGPDKFYS